MNPQKKGEGGLFCCRPLALLSPRTHVEKIAQDFFKSSMASARETRLVSILHELSHSHQRTLILFRKWDEDGSGSVGINEFWRGLKALGVTDNLPALKDSKKSDIDALFQLIDGNGDGNGQLNFEELGKAVSGMLEKGILENGIATAPAGAPARADAAKKPRGKVSKKLKSDVAAKRALAKSEPTAQTAAKSIQARVRGGQGRKRARDIKVATNPSEDPEVHAALHDLRLRVAEALQKILNIFQLWDYDGNVSARPEIPICEPVASHTSLSASCGEGYGYPRCAEGARKGVRIPPPPRRAPSAKRSFGRASRCSASSLHDTWLTGCSTCSTPTATTASTTRSYAPSFRGSRSFEGRANSS